MHVLPLLWHLLSTLAGGVGSHGSASVYESTCNLSVELEQCMGAELVELASANTSVPPRNLKLLQDMIADT